MKTHQLVQHCPAHPIPHIPDIKFSGPTSSKHIPQQFEVLLWADRKVDILLDIVFLCLI
jgi:hypothetical protein